MCPTPTCFWGDSISFDDSNSANVISKPHHYKTYIFASAKATDPICPFPSMNMNNSGLYNFKTNISGWLLLTHTGRSYADCRHSAGRKQAVDHRNRNRNSAVERSAQDDKKDRDLEQRRDCEPHVHASSLVGSGGENTI